VSTERRTHEGGAGKADGPARDSSQPDHVEDTPDRTVPDDTTPRADRPPDGPAPGDPPQEGRTPHPDRTRDPVPPATAADGEPAREAEVTAAGGGPGGPDTGRASDSTLPQGRRGRSRARLSVVGSVVLAVLLAGGGGAYLATTASDGHDGASGPGTGRSGDGGDPPPLALDGFNRGDADTTGDSPGGPGIAPGEPDPSGAHGVVYRALQALPDGPSSAKVHGSAGAVTAEQVSRLGKALGIDGTPRLSQGSWQLGAGEDGTGPRLRVTRKAPGSWTFDRTVPGRGNCTRGTTCSGEVTGTQGRQPVSESAAKTAAAPVLKALGQDGAKVDAGQLMGPVRVVNADPEVDGLPTYGWSTGIRVGADGMVTGGSGQMLAPVAGDTYPVLGADKTLDLLNKAHQHPVSPGVCPDVPPRKGVPEEKQGQPGTGSGCGQPGEKGPAQKPAVMPVRGAAFGLATHFVAGRPALVPSWFFEVRPQGAEDSFTLTYPAVDPAYLADGGGAPGGKELPGAKDLPGDSSKVHISSYTTSGRSLTVHFYGGVCSTYQGAADETSGKVTVNVTQHDESGKTCIMIAKEHSKTVTLDQPLGDRKVVDGMGATVHQD
jgi:hypothetical protein